MNNVKAKCVPTYRQNGKPDGFELRIDGVTVDAVKAAISRACPWQYDWATLHFEVVEFFGPRPSIANAKWEQGIEVAK